MVCMFVVRLVQRCQDTQGLLELLVKVVKEEMGPHNICATESGGPQLKFDED